MAKVAVNTVKSEDKATKVDETMKAMEKQFGKGTVMGAQDKSKFHEFIPTGSVSLDKALGIGGLPKGRIVELQGWESSGKTTLAIHAIAEAHKDPNSYCAFVDMEHAFDTNYAEKLGVDLTRLKISQPDWGEQALEVTDKLIESGLFDIVVLDSIAACVPKAELEREMGESAMGKHSILMSQAMRKLNPVVGRTKTLLILINQKREKIGVMFGDASTTPGGNAVKFYASVRLDVTRSTTNANSTMEGETKLGNLTKVKVIKNKTAPPFRQCEFQLIYGEGIDKKGELLDLAVETGIVTKAGTFFAYNGNNIGQGRAKAVEALGNEALYFEIKDKVQQSYIPTEFVPTAEDLDLTEKKEVKDGI